MRCLGDHSPAGRQLEQCSGRGAAPQQLQQRGGPAPHPNPTPGSGCSPEGLGAQLAPAPAALLSNPENGGSWGQTSLSPSLHLLPASCAWRGLSTSPCATIHSPASVPPSPHGARPPGHPAWHESREPSLRPALWGAGGPCLSPVHVAAGSNSPMLCRRGVSARPGAVSVPYAQWQ